MEFIERNKRSVLAIPVIAVLLILLSIVYNGTWNTNVVNAGATDFFTSSGMKFTPEVKKL